VHHLEKFEALMTELGPVLNPLSISYFSGDNTWAVQLDEETGVLVDFVADQGKFVLHCELGAPPAGDRFTLYELLLRYNYHWNDTGGGRMALDENGGNVVFLFESSAHDMDVTQLTTILRNFHDAALAWKIVVHESGPNQSPQSTEHMFANMIRG
jgi:hypothetical protein